MERGAILLNLHMPHKDKLRKVVREKLEEEPVNEPHILLGPVIGKVTEQLG